MVRRAFSCISSLLPGTCQRKAYDWGEGAHSLQTWGRVMQPMCHSVDIIIYGTTNHFRLGDLLRSPVFFFDCCSHLRFLLKFYREETKQLCQLEIQSMTLKLTHSFGSRGCWNSYRDHDVSIHKIVYHDNCGFFRLRNYYIKSML